MIRVMFVTAGSILEISCMSTILRNPSSDRIWIMLLFQHAAASVLLASFMWYSMPEKLRRPREQVMLLLFNVSFFIPFLGLPGVLVAVLVSGYRRRVVISQPFAKLTSPEFVPSRREPEGKVSQVSLKSRLAHLSIPTPQRLQSLLALQGMPSKVSSPLLKNMLGDAADDIRLVAYGLLDSWEKNITAQIHRELANLKTAEGKDLRLTCQRHLAELYWELAYSGLAQDDMRTHALNQALSHIDDALQLARQQTGLWFLKGRILHKMKRDEEACQILEKAMANGLPESRVLPYLAEIAFDRGDYTTVRNLLSRIPVAQVTPIMKEVIHFWSYGAEHEDAAAAKAEAT